MTIPPNWIQKNNGIFRELVFNDFSEALAMMVRIGIEVEKIDHHPEWTNVYNRLSIFLTTHDVGDLTQKDIDLANRINLLVD